MKDQDELNPWVTLSRKTIYETPWIRVVEHECLSPQKNPAIYGVVEFKNLAIGILTIDSDKQIILVGQWRYPLDQYSWEIPEGGGREGISPLIEAQRELKEETGIEAQKWTKLFDMHLSNSTTNERAQIFLAEDLRYGDASPEETEVFKVARVSVEAAYEMIVRGEITDSISVAAIQFYYLSKLLGKTYLSL